MEFSPQFIRAFKFTVAEEGYISDDKDDKGGKTVYGIASRWWPKVVEDILSKRTKEEQLQIAREFYYNNYWFKAACNSLVWPDYLVMFDAAVQHDPHTAQGIWNRAGGNWQKAIDGREAYYKHLVETNPKNEKFIHGWLNRIDALRRECEKREL